MKAIYLSMLCLCFCTEVKAQEEAISLSNDELSSLINKHFLQYSAGQSTSSSSSFAGLDIDKTEFAFSPTYVTKNSNVWNAKFKGGITDGMASLFNNNKFNTNMGVELEFNLNLCRKGNIKVAYMDEDYIKFRKDMIDQLKKSLIECKAIIKTNKKLTEGNYLTRINTALDSIPDTESIAQLKAYEKKLYDLYKALDGEISALITDRLNFTAIEEEKILDAFSGWSNSIAQVYKTRESGFKFSRFHSEWLTFGVHVRNDQFRLLDRTALFDEQIEKTTYINYGAKIQYNSYYFKKYGNSVFYNFGLQYQNKSNFQELSTVEIVENESIGSNTTTTRTSDDTFTAYEGDYKKHLDQLNINADFFYFINRFQNVGIHIYENSKIMKTLKPTHNIGLGLVFPFKDKEKDATVINAEIYYTLTNVFNTEGTTYGLLERNDIGLRFTFPIDFNLN